VDIPGGRLLQHPANLIDETPCLRHLPPEFFVRFLSVGHLEADPSQDFREGGDFHFPLGRGGDFDPLQDRPHLVEESPLRLLIARKDIIDALHPGHRGQGLQGAADGP